MDKERGIAGGSDDERLEIEPARNLAVLKSIAEGLNSAADVRQALERTLALVVDLLGLQTGWIWLLNPEDQQFYLAAAQNLPPFLQEPVRMSGRRCLCTEVFRKGELQPTNIGVLSCSRLSEAFTAQVPQETLGLRFHASIPLYFKERPLGIINITGPSERKLTTDELRLLETIAYQVGIAVDRARLAEESTRLARAQERTRIAREIHDTLAQGLTAIALDIEGALRHLEDSPQRARERLERALTTTHHNLEEARSSMLDLRSGPPEGRPLAEALEALGRSFTSDTGIPVQVRLNSPRPVPLRIESGLYRIVQEALANVRKHANATRVEIELRTTPQEVRLAIRDDGVGFDPEREANEGQGILGMRERVQLLDGRLRLTSQLGRGTGINVRVPFPGEGEA